MAVSRYSSAPVATNSACAGLDPQTDDFSAELLPAQINSGGRPHPAENGRSIVASAVAAEDGIQGNAGAAPMTDAELALPRFSGAEC